MTGYARRGTAAGRLTVAGGSIDSRVVMSNRTASKKSVDTRGALRFTRVNAILLAAGLGSVAIGYALLARGSTVAAPLLLVLGYAVLIPIGIIR
jgi:hypothetical protein